MCKLLYLPLGGLKQRLRQVLQYGNGFILFSFLNLTNTSETKNSKSFFTVMNINTQRSAEFTLYKMSMETHATLG